MSSIITVTDLQNYTGKTLVSSTATQVVNAVNQWVETYTGRCFGETKTVTETYDIDNTVWLRHQDVTSVASVQMNYPGSTISTLDSASYRYSSLGRITFYVALSVPRTLWARDSLVVTYSYGLSPVPADLVTACLGIAAGLYNYAVNGQQNVVAASVGSYRVEYAGAVRSTGDPSPANNTAEFGFKIIDTYRARRV